MAFWNKKKDKSKNPFSFFGKKREEVSIEETEDTKESDELPEEQITQDDTENINSLKEHNIDEEESFESTEEISVAEKDEIDGEEFEEEMQEKKVGFFGRLKQGLFKTRTAITDKINTVFKAFKKVDEELFEELEEVLIMADVGAHTSAKIVDMLRQQTKEQKIIDADEVKGLLKKIISDILGEDKKVLKLNTTPSIMVIIGVNGAGKTTSIGKIANKLRNEGKKVLLAAADTFRAAAVEQLEIWANRAGIDVIKQAEGSDPAAVIFDAMTAAKARKVDVVICDTAGRLHNKKNLMEELKKIFRVIEREMPESDKEALLVLDATTGQNALNQAKLFNEVSEVSGIILTKLDGTAKGGIIIGISEELSIPVKFIGVGEKIEDLQEFDPAEFARALFD